MEKTKDSPQNTEQPEQETVSLGRSQPPANPAPKDLASPIGWLGWVSPYVMKMNP
jgi:hypothetical protein